MNKNEIIHIASEADFLFNKTITDKIEGIFKNSNELSFNVDIQDIDILPIGNQKPNPAEKRAGLMV